MESLYDSLTGILDVMDPRPAESIPQTDTQALVDITDPKEFCQRVVQTREFRQYIMNGIVLGDIPPAVVCRVIDHAWGKPPERVEVTDVSELVNLTPELAAQKLERVQQMLQLLRRAQLDDEGELDTVSVH